MIMASKRKKVMPFAKKLTNLELIGSGSFGKVYKVTMRENGALKDHALKVVQCNSSENTELALRESRALSHLTGHPNIVKFKVAYLQIEEELDQIDPNNKTKGLLSLIEASIKGEVTKQMKKGKVKLWFQMEYCNQGDMNNYLLDREPNSALNTSILRQLAKGISFLHENNITHRDLKPENVLVNIEKSGDTPVFKIADFGLSKVCTANGDGHNSGFYQRVMSSACGSEFFMAPEVFDKNYTPKADVFSLGIIFWAVMDRITFISAGTQKLLLGTYVRVHNKEVIPVGEALLDDPTLDVRKLLRATSKRKPYKRDDLYNADKSCTLVIGDVVKLRELVAKMILKDADIRPNSHVLLKKLEAALKPSPRSMSSVRKAAAIVSQARKTRFSIKKEAESKIKVVSAADQLHPVFTKDDANCPRRVVASPPSSPIRITRNKKLSTKGKHVTGVVHKIVGEDSSVEDTESAGNSQRRSVRLSLKNVPQCFQSKEVTLQLSRVCSSESVKKSPSKVPNKASSIKKSTAKTRQTKLNRIRAARILRSSVTKRQKSLRSYNCAAEPCAAPKTPAVPPKKRQKKAFVKEESASVKKSIPPPSSSVLMDVEIDSDSLASIQSSSDSVKVATKSSNDDLPTKPSSKPALEGVKTNSSNKSLSPRKRLSSSTTSHGETPSDLRTCPGQPTAARLDFPSDEDGTPPEVRSSVEQENHIPSTKQRMSLLQQINQAPKPRFPTPPRMSEMEKADLINRRKKIAEAMMLKHAPDSAKGSQSSFASVADISNNTTNSTQVVANNSPVLSPSMSCLSKVTYTTTTARATPRVYHSPVWDEADTQRSGTSVLRPPVLNVRRPPIKLSVGGKRKASEESHCEPIVKVRKYATPYVVSRSKGGGQQQPDSSKVGKMPSNGAVFRHTTSLDEHNIPVIDLTGSSHSASGLSSTSAAKPSANEPVVSVQYHKHSQHLPTGVLSPCSTDRPVDLTVGSASLHFTHPQATSQPSGSSGTAVFCSKVLHVSSSQAVPLHPHPSSVTATANMQANHLVASHMNFSAMYDKSLLPPDMRPMQGYPPWYQNQMSAKGRLMAPH